MAFVLAILGAIGAAAVVLWRLKMAADATRDIVEAAGDARKFVRRTRWKSHQNAAKTEVPDDPRAAAAAMMTAVAEADGALTETERKAILGEITTRFELEPKPSDELLAYGRWISRNAGDLAAFLRRMSPPVRTGCTEQERHDLLDMLTAVAKADGPADEIATTAITALKRHLNVG